jgi:nucleotide-binding universal stress UspA family protein
MAIEEIIREGEPITIVLDVFKEKQIDLLIMLDAQGMTPGALPVRTQ